MDIQRSIGADIIMAFDECPPYPCDYEYARKSMEMTHRWLDRCIQRLDETAPRYGHTQHLFPIVQGSTFKDLRQKSAEEIASREAEGNAIGGLSVGEPHEDMYATTELVCGILPEDKPRYLMGVGTPVNILESIGLGVDMFDCVLPTRNARHGMLYTWDGVMKNWFSDLRVFEEIRDCGHWLPLEQAEPALTQKPARSKAMTWVSAGTPSIAAHVVLARRRASVPKIIAPAWVKAASRRVRRASWRG